MVGGESEGGGLSWLSASSLSLVLLAWWMSGIRPEKAHGSRCGYLCVLVLSFLAGARTGCCTMECIATTHRVANKIPPNRAKHYL